MRKRLGRLRRRLIRRLRQPIDPVLAAIEVYRQQIRDARPVIPVVGQAALIRDFIPWYRSLSRSAVEVRRPWITFESARLLEAALKPSSRVFEYGAGGSTLFLGERAAAVVSVEHDPEWFVVVRGAVADLPAVRLELAPPRPIVSAADAAVTSELAEYAGQTFADYVGIVDAYPDHHFDMLVVDGRSRTSCFFRGERKVRVGGIVVYDDTDRPAYAAAVTAARAAGWLERGRFGPKPFSRRFSRTTVWTKTSDLGQLGDPA